MIGKVTFKDTLSGNISISDNKRSYFKTKDSSSPSGHSLVAQIEMTHSGIVTRNYGFYLPTRMKDGAASFTRNYAKPVIIGHDEFVESKPVGRVVQADYINTSDKYVARDSYLKNYLGFQDKTKKVSDLVQHVIRKYDGTDGYKGLGHIRGTVNITCGETIEAILDRRYMTVSTSMVSDAAYCSVCNQEWVSEGPCEHVRGQTYDDKVCVLVPGRMDYEHLGIVNSPADVNAHSFEVISLKDNVEKDSDNKENCYVCMDKYDLAAELFAYNDNSLVSLSSETDANLITIKDNIQRVEDAMADQNKETKEKKTKKKDDNEESNKKKNSKQMKSSGTCKSESDAADFKAVEDAMRVAVNIYSYGEEGNRDITVAEYIENLDEEAVNQLVSQVIEIARGSSEVMDDSTINDAINKFVENSKVNVKDNVKNNDEYEGAKQVSNLGDDARDMIYKNLKYWDAPDENFDEEELAMGIQVEKEHNDDVEIAKAIAKAHLNEIPDYYTRLKDMEEEGKKEWELRRQGTEGTPNKAGSGYSDLSGDNDSTDLDNNKVSLKDMSGDEVYELMSKHINEEKILDKEIRDSLKANAFCGTKGFFPVMDAEHYHAVVKVLDEVEVDAAAKNRIIKAADKLVKRLNIDLAENFDKGQKTCDNNDVTKEDLLKVFNDTKQKLIELGVELDESKDQEVEILDAQLDAANEEIDSLENVVSEMKKELAENLATQIIDKRLAKGSIKVEDKTETLNELKARNLDSLRDTLEDLNKELEMNDGINNTPEHKVSNPVLQNDHDAKSKSNSVDKYKLYDQYRSICNTKGKKVADAWLNRIQKENGYIPTID